MTWLGAFGDSGIRVATTAHLQATGATTRSLQAAVDNSFLIRVRRGYYALPGTDRHVLEAVRLGGRLGCTSAAADRGVFVLDARPTHIHLEPNASRLRSPMDRSQLLSARNRRGVVLHWGALAEPAARTECSIGLKDSLIQMMHCQETRFAAASIDDALRQKLIFRRDVPDIFAALPDRFRPLQRLIDGRGDSGQEFVLRFIVREAGFACETQVPIPGVGRVDMVVEGCVIVEADSRTWHDGWEAHSRDRSRDREAAIRQYPSYRALKDDILYHPEKVIAAISGLLAANRHYRTIHV